MSTFKFKWNETKNRKAKMKHETFKWLYFASWIIVIFGLIVITCLMPLCARLYFFFHLSLFCHISTSSEISWREFRVFFALVAHSFSFIFYRFWFRVWRLLLPVQEIAFVFVLVAYCRFHCINFYSIVKSTANHVEKMYEIKISCLRLLIIWKIFSHCCRPQTENA